jgi:hypothetical protein
MAPAANRKIAGTPGEPSVTLRRPKEAVIVTE